VLVEPDVFGWCAFAEEQQVGLDARVRGEYAIWQADDGVQVAVFSSFP
jgi:hypothetical protein